MGERRYGAAGTRQTRPDRTDPHSITALASVAPGQEIEAGARKIYAIFPMN
jgi:hypothetical protein